MTSSICSRPHRIHTYIDHIKTRIRRQIKRLLKILFCLISKSNNNISRQRDISLQPSYFIHKNLELFDCISAKHLFQNNIRSRLQWHMDMRTHFWFVFMEIKKFIRIMRRIRRRISEPYKTVKSKDTFAYFHKFWMFIDDLSEKHDFLYSVIKMMLHFLENILYLKMFLQSSCIWHNTKRTKLTTSCTNRHIRGLRIFLKELICSLWYNTRIFIHNLSIIRNLISEFFHHQREKTRIIYPKQQLNIRMFFCQIIEEGIECMVYIHNIPYHLFDLRKFFVHLLRRDTKHIRVTRHNISHKVSRVHESGYFFITQNIIDCFISEIMLHHTSCDPYLLGRIDLLDLSRDLILRLLTYTTSIKNHKLRLINRLDIFPVTVRQNGFYPCSIAIVHLTPKDQYMEFHKRHKVTKK